MQSEVKYAILLVVAFIQIESIKGASMYNNINSSDLYFRSQPENEEEKKIEEMNLCIEICSECFKDDLENKENVVL